MTILNPINTDQRSETPLSRKISSEVLNALDIDDEPQPYTEPHPSAEPHPSKDNSELLNVFNVPPPSVPKDEVLQSNTNPVPTGGGNECVPTGGGNVLSEYVNTNPVPTGGGNECVTDEEDPFKSIPKSVDHHSELSAADSDTGGATAFSQHPIQLVSLR